LHRLNSDVEKLLAQRAVHQRFIAAVRSRHGDPHDKSGKTKQKAQPNVQNVLSAEAGLALTAMEKALAIAIFFLCKTDHKDALECEGR
jgi:hypothetical protein